MSRGDDFGSIRLGRIKPREILGTGSKKSHGVFNQWALGLGRGDNQFGIVQTNACEYYLLKKTPAIDKRMIS